MFRTQFDKPERFYTDVGSRDVPTYRAVIDDAGRIDLVQSGLHNLYSEIQSHRDGVDIHVILERFAETGDQTLIDRRQALYLDVADFPKTYAEMYQQIMDSKAEFYQLPLEIRAKFNHSPEEFFASIGTQKWFDVFGQNDNNSDVGASAAAPDPAAGVE